MALFFSRDTKVFLKQTGDVAHTWEIPVLEGFSFSQATNTSEVTLSEARKSSSDTKSKRSRKMFNDSYAPAEWSFSTYVRPIQSGNTTGDWEDANDENRGHAIEEALWANFVANNSLSSATASSAAKWASGVTSASSSTVIDFTGSEVSALGTFELFFQIGSTTVDNQRKTYKLTNCVVNEAVIDFDIDGIATIQWSGFASEINDEGSAVPTRTIYEGITDTDNFIRNRLTSLAITATDTAKFPGASNNGVYNATLTGGSITFSNNITYLTPETLGKVDRPIGHVTGARNISGNFTCYLDNAAGDVDQLFENIIDQERQITNDFRLDFKIGGTSTPNLQIDLKQAHLEIPTHSVDDIISMEVNFHGLTDTLDPGTSASSYEAVLTYNAKV